MTDYEAAWADLQRREFRLWGVILLYPLALLLVAWPLSQVMQSETPYTVVGILWIAGLVLPSCWHHTQFACPRCHNRFFAKPYWHNAFTSRCLHCGLPKGAPHPEP